MNNKQNRALPPIFKGMEPLSRRGFLRAAVITGAAVTAGCTRLIGRPSAPKALAYRHMTPEEGGVMEKLVRVLLPTEKLGLPSSTHEIPTIQNVDEMVGDMPKQTRNLFGLTVWVFEHKPMASFSFKRFSKLDDDKALAYVHAMQHGSFLERGIMTTLGTLVNINYWRDPRTYPELDYEGPVTKKWGIPSLGNTPLPEA